MPYVTGRFVWEIKELDKRYFLLASTAFITIQEKLRHFTNEYQLASTEAVPLL